MRSFQPHAGQIYAKAHNVNIRVLVITPIDRICNNGWFCLGLPIFRNGSYGRVMLVSVHADDVLQSTGNRLPPVAAEALRRHRAMQRRARAAYVNDDSFDLLEGGRVLFIRGGI